MTLPLSGSRLYRVRVFYVENVYRLLHKHTSGKQATGTGHKISQPLLLNDPYRKPAYPPTPLSEVYEVDDALVVLVLDDNAPDSSDSMPHSTAHNTIMLYY